MNNVKTIRVAVVGGGILILKPNVSRGRGPERPPLKTVHVFFLSSKIIFLLFP